MRIHTANKQTQSVITDQCQCYWPSSVPIHLGLSAQQRILNWSKFRNGKTDHPFNNGFELKAATITTRRPSVLMLDH